MPPAFLVPSAALFAVRVSVPDLPSAVGVSAFDAMSVFDGSAFTAPDGLLVVAALGAGAATGAAARAGAGVSVGGGADVFTPGSRSAGLGASCAGAGAFCACDHTPGATTNKATTS